MSEPKTRIPAPLYAAAGVGDLAYQQLRKLPGLVNDLSGRAVASGAELRERGEQLRGRGAELRDKAAARAAGLRERAAGSDWDLNVDVERVRELAKRNAAAFATAAQAAQAKAVAVYGDLVARGALVIGDAAETVTEDAVAEVDAATAPAELPAAAAPAASGTAKKATKTTKATATKKAKPAES